MPLDQHPPREKVPRIPSSLDLDPRLMQEFPHGSKCVESVVYGTAAWTNAQRITLELPDGSRQSFFLKSGPGEQGKNMMEAEFLGMTELHSVMPEFFPRPCNWGRYDLSETYFFYMEFLDLSQQEMPEPEEFCYKLSQLHETSKSPKDKFGFYRSTFQGPIEIDNTWESNWCVFMTRLLTKLFEREIAQNGPYPELEQALKIFMDKTIKLVLEPLQAEGRELKPCLIHGDMWEENASTNLATGATVIYDPTAVYAHHEFEVGMWRGEVYRFGPAYLRQYLMHFPPSDPIEQFDDRHRIYSMKHSLVRVLNYPNQPDRDLLRDDLEFLNKKYNVE